MLNRKVLPVGTFFCFVIFVILKIHFILVEPAVPEKCRFYQQLIIKMRSNKY